jgi:uncharacterized protein YndB with AHSA1/START domain
MLITSESSTGPAVALSCSLRAPRPKVFRTWTDPSLLSKWFFAEEGFRTHDVTVDLRPLGAYQIVVSPVDGGDPTRIHGHYVDVEPDRALTYTWTGACADEQYWTLVNVRFDEAADGGTRLSLTHGVFRTDADRAMHEQGWFACLSSLERCVAA